MKFSNLLFVFFIAITASSCGLISALGGESCDFVYPVTFMDSEGTMVEATNSDEATELLNWIENQATITGENSEENCGGKRGDCGEEVVEISLENVQFPLQVETFDGTIVEVNNQTELMDAFSDCLSGIEVQ